MFVFTWPTRGHDDDHDEEEKCEERQTGGQIAAAVIESELPGVPQQDPLLLLPGGQLELGVGHLVLGGVVDLVVPGPRLLGQGQRSVDHQCGLLQVMDINKGFCNAQNKNDDNFGFWLIHIIIFH